MTFTQELLNLFQSKMRGIIKTYYDGEIKPSDITNVDLPLLSVQKLNTGFDEAGTGTMRDNVIWHYRLTVWIDRKMMLDNTTDEPEIQNTTQKTLEEIVEGMNSDFSYKDTSLIGILRQNLTVNGKVFYTNNVVARYENYVIEDEYQLAKAEIEFDAFHKISRIS